MGTIFPVRPLRVPVLQLHARHLEQLGASLREALRPAPVDEVGQVGKTKMRFKRSAIPILGSARECVRDL